MHIILVKKLRMEFVKHSLVEVILRKEKAEPVARNNCRYVFFIAGMFFLWPWVEISMASASENNIVPGLYSF